MKHKYVSMLLCIAMVTGTVLPAAAEETELTVVAAEEFDGEEPASEIEETIEDAGFEESAEMKEAEEAVDEVIEITDEVIDEEIDEDQKEEIVEEAVEEPAPATE